MGRKRKPESPLQSEPSLKIRRTSPESDLEKAQNHLPIEIPPDSPSSSPSCSDQVESEVEAEAESEVPSSYRAPLTKDNLRQFEEMTGSRKTGALTSASSRTQNTNSSSKADAKSRFSTTDLGFEVRFRSNGTVPPIDKKTQKNPPSNLAVIEAALNRERASASPTLSDHEAFLDELVASSNERHIEAMYSTRVFKDTNRVPELQRIGYRAVLDKQWLDYEKEADFNNGLAPPKPDRTEGYQQKTFPSSIERLGGAATLVKDNPNFPALPHFTVEFKDRGKDFAKAEVQAGYDGAAMAHAHNKARQYIGQPDPPRHSTTMSMASDGQHWAAYAHYTDKDEATGKVEHYQYEVDTGTMTKLKDFKRGYKVNRNAQDWGRQQSTELRDSLQQHYETYGDVPAAIPGAKAHKGQATGSSGKQSAANSTGTKTARSQSSRSSDAGSYRGDGPKPSASRAASTGSGDRPRNRGEIPTPSSSGSPRRSLAQ